MNILETYVRDLLVGSTVDYYCTIHDAIYRTRLGIFKSSHTHNSITPYNGEFKADPSAIITQDISNNQFQVKI
jgi:hypothetical protein